MSVKAKIVIDDKEIAVQAFSFGFNQLTNYSGRPLQKAAFIGLKLTLETRKDCNLADWSLSPKQTKQIALHIYPVVVGGKTSTLYFYDCYLVNWKNIFSPTGVDPMAESLEITAAGVENSDAAALYSAPWRTTFPQKGVAPTSIESDAAQEDEISFKFTAKLERLDSYKGEFGFDWMREDYKIICEDYERLKKEYTPITIHRQEYFVPWLSMFPKQKNVKLRLVITEIEGTAKNIDVIKLPSKNGIKFEPSELKVSEANGKEIAVFCESPVSKNTAISLLDKDHAEVGKINIFKNENHEQLHFDITPVRILRAVSKARDKEVIQSKIDQPQGFGDKSKDIRDDLQNLQDYLNTQSLNQALLQCQIGEVYDVVINEDKWIADDLIVEVGCVFKGNLLDKFNQEFQKQHPVAFKNRGITMYISPLHHEKAGGYGNLGDVDAKGLVIFRSNLWDKTTFAHEIAHVAGLEHSFREDDDIYGDKKVLDDHNAYIKQVDDYLNYMISSGASEREIADFWNTKKEDYSYVRSKLNIYYRNLHKFKQSATDNFMDYYNARETFWKFQWKALQDDILKFYKS